MAQQESNVSGENLLIRRLPSFYEDYISSMEMHSGKTREKAGGRRYGTMIQNFGGDGLSHYSVWFEQHQADIFMV